MNQLAKVIRNIDSDRKDIEPCVLTPLELITLNSISGILSMTLIELETFLKQEGEPIDWLITPPIITSTKEVD